MNPQVYKIENNDNKINLFVKVITVDGALVTPGVDLFINQKKYPKEKSSDSEDNTSNYLIGVASNLQYGLLVIDIVINLKFIDEDYWESCFDKLKIEYKFNGGINDNSFKHESEDIKYKSNSGKIIQTEKRFFLKQI